MAPEYSLREVPAPPLGSTITKVQVTYIRCIAWATYPCRVTGWRAVNPRVTAERSARLSCCLGRCVCFYEPVYKEEMSGVPHTPLVPASPSVYLQPSLHLPYYKTGSIAPEYSLREVPAPPLGSTITKVSAHEKKTIARPLILLYAYLPY